jgi:hypothetical protein
MAFMHKDWLAYASVHQKAKWAQATRYEPITEQSFLTESKETKG